MLITDHHTNALKLLEIVGLEENCTIRDGGY